MRISSSVSTVIALLALFVALAGTGYAAVTLPRASVGTPQLREGAVVSPKVRDGSLHARDLAPGELFPEILPRGRTLRGVYYLGSSSAAGNQLATGQISFPVRLGAPPIAHFVGLEAVPPAACTGTALRPAAAPGHLCVYEARESGAAAHRVIDPVSGRVGGVVRAWGAGLSVRAVRGGDVFSSGTWAVTAR
jgi:hypothetical protein